MNSYIFPGQGAQFVGMGKDLYDKNDTLRQYFEQANKILGFNITDEMFSGTDEGLKQTRITQPAIFIHSVISAFDLAFLGDINKCDKLIDVSLDPIEKKTYLTPFYIDRFR